MNLFSTNCYSRAGYCFNQFGLATGYAAALVGLLERMGDVEQKPKIVPRSVRITFSFPLSFTLFTANCMAAAYRNRPFFFSQKLQLLTS